MFEAQIAKGIEYLDQDLGTDWPEKVNIVELKLDSSCGCVIGQLYGNFFHRFDVDEAVPFGFTSPLFEEYGQLEKEWREKIAQLRIDRQIVELYQDELGMQALDSDGLDSEGQQAWNAFQRAEGLTWEERERLNDLERIAYCGWED